MKSILPRQGLFEIRFESIGGLGAHVAGQILAAAAVSKLGLNGAHFSSYGSEKKGSPVRSYVRLGPSDKAIRTSSPIEAPNVIVVFHEALLKNPVTFAGLRSDGIFIFNGALESLPETLALLPKKAKVIRVDAIKIAVEEKSRPNAVLLGTLCRVCPFLKADVILEALSEGFAGKHPEAVSANERAFRRGSKEFEILEGVGQRRGSLPAVRPKPVWGYKTAPIGGLLPLAGNSVWNDLSASRIGWMPVFDSAACIHCGLCDLVCPDFCFVWVDGETGGKFRRKLKGVDYRYCKGCLRCVDSCPTGALSKQIETPGLAEISRVPLFPEMIK